MNAVIRGLLFTSLVFLASRAIAAERKPAILFCSPQGPSYGWIDLAYLAELHAHEFEVDYTDDLGDITAERIKRYNVLVIYITPDAWEVTMRARPSSPEKVKTFAELIDRYAASGGGVFLMPTEGNMRRQVVRELTDLWGAKLPVETIEEKDRQKVASLSHASQDVPLALTDQVLPSPVSDGVRHVWYPIRPAYNAAQTGPIDVDASWQVVVKGSKTSVTRPVDLAKSVMPELDRPFQRPEGVAEPTLFAIRQYQDGRVALINQWRQFSIGAGTKYIYNREALSRGLNGIPSDLGRLLENTYRWLAQPSLASGIFGGYVTTPDRLLPPNQKPETRKAYADRTWPYDPATLDTVVPPAHTRLFRGLIGAKTGYSSGNAGVEAYAKAAAYLGLDFLVFLDDFEQLTPEKLEQLKADCDRFSTDKLRLFPGFSITNNIGNRMFFYSPDPAWIPDYCLTGPNKKTLYIQEEDGKGGYTGYLTPFLDWVLGSYHVEKGQVGYFHFSASPHGMRMPDLRLYGMAALRYYKDGRLVEDNTDAYLTTAQATIPPAPVSVNELAGPEQLAREIQSGHALVYARARSLESLFMDALRWTHQYDAPCVFVSDGPQVALWPSCYRVSTLGAEEFVTGVSVMPSPLLVTSDKGIKEIRIFNGRELFRRFLPGGAKKFQQMLVLDGSIQKNLVVIAEDVEGKKAVTFARRCWKDGSLAVSFCSDHVNDGTMALAHGPYAYPVIRHPFLPNDIAGDTWDGGPLASLPLTGHQNTNPAIDSDKGKESGERFNQTPLLEFTDEGAMAVSSPRTEVFDERVQRVVNPWHTYGPIAGPSRLMDYTQRYREYLPPTVGVPETGWAGPGVRAGTNASLFRNEVTFKDDLALKSFTWGYFSGNSKARVVLNLGGSITTLDLSQPGKAETYVVNRGDWIGYYSPELSNSNLFFNRSEPIRIENRAPYLFFRAEPESTAVKKGQTRVFEMAAIGFPLNVEIQSAADLERYAAYLAQPSGMQVVRGKRIEGPGLVEFAPDATGVVEFSVPKPATKLDLTLPCRIVGLNPRWSAGLRQKKGFVKGDYGPGENRYRALGMDLEGNAYVPVYVDLADVTHLEAGHPIVAGPEGKELFLQVTKVGQQPDRWHVSVNNPTDRPITTTLKQAMDLPGLGLSETTITLQPGEYVVLR